MSERKLCPFRKIIRRDLSGRTFTLRDRFQWCAGKKCMAYSDGKCLKLERLKDLEKQVEMKE